MNRISRRKFLKRSISATAGSYMALSSQACLLPSVRGANNEVRIAVAGIRGRGGGHIKNFQKLDGVNVVALCDPDSQVLAKGVTQFKDKYGSSVTG